MPDICPVNHSFVNIYPMHSISHSLFYLATIICYLKGTLPRQQKLQLHMTDSCLKDSNAEVDMSKQLSAKKRSDELRALDSGTRQKLTLERC